jgi:hypothetical protein
MTDYEPSAPPRRGHAHAPSATERSRLSVCGRMRLDGQRCGLPARDGGDGGCWAHDSTLAEARRAGNAKGGRSSATAARAQRKMPTELQHVADVLVRAIAAVESGALGPGQGSAISSLCKSLVMTYEAAETTSVEKRLREMEQELRRGQAPAEPRKTA